jgi:flagellar biosynthesis protein FliQ
VDALQPVVRETLLVTAILCFPVLTAATAVGLLVAVLQAATQIQEQTLTLLPKMAVVGTFMAAFGEFGLHLCATLLFSSLRALPAIVRGP